MKDGGRKWWTRVVLTIVEEGWPHDMVLSHEDIPFTIDGIVMDKRFDNAVVGDGIFRDDHTGGEGKTEDNTKYETIIVV